MVIKRTKLTVEWSVETACEVRDWFVNGLVVFQTPDSAPGKNKSFLPLQSFKKKEKKNKRKNTHKKRKKKKQAKQFSLPFKKEKEPHTIKNKEFYYNNAQKWCWQFRAWCLIFVFDQKRSRKKEKRKLSVQENDERKGKFIVEISRRKKNSMTKSPH